MSACTAAYHCDAVDVQDRTNTTCSILQKNRLETLTDVVYAIVDLEDLLPDSEAGERRRQTAIAILRISVEGT
jgi:hypothetical protein